MQYFSRTHHAWSAGKFLFPCQENEGSGSKRLHSLFLRCTFCTGKFCTWSDYFFTYETGFLPDLCTVGHRTNFCLKKNLNDLNRVSLDSIEANIKINVDLFNQFQLWLIDTYCDRFSRLFKKKPQLVLKIILFTS